MYRRALVALLSVLFTASLIAQAPQAPSRDNPQPPATAGTPQQAPQKPANPETKITPQQAQELFRDIDSLLKWVSADTKLPIHNEVKKKLSSRDEVQKYVEDNMKDDEDTKRFERSAVVLKKFGFLPRDFQLRPFLLKMLREQVAGFYDAKTKTVYLLDWVQPEIQRPVMAHELTHALQDQNFDLQKFGKETARNDAEKRGDINTAVSLDEVSTARTAMVEGQGMISLVDYMLKDYGRTAADAPEAVDMLGSSMEKSNDSPVFEEAPMLLRESLLFPYQSGMKFVDQVLIAKGKDGAFAGMFARPPQTSYEVMNPQQYLAGKVPTQVALPDLAKLLGKGYAEYDLGAMGELDVELFLKQFSDVAMTKALTPQWDGGAYYAALKKDADPQQTSSIALVYVGQWKSPEAAQAFAKVYAASVLKKYSSVHAAECSPCDQGERRWNTEEGFVQVVQRGPRVAVTEGVDQPTALKLRDAVLGGTGEQLSAGKGELTLRAIPQWMRAMIMTRFVQ